MAISNLVPVNGVVQSIRPFPDQCCQQILSLRTSNGINNFVITPRTHVINEILLRPGMQVTAFYDGDSPVPLIYPPQYQAVIISRRNPNETIVADYFDNDLVNENNTLKLNISPSTDVYTSNGQRFTCPIGDRLLVVYYTNTTRSIPPQTTPRKVIVMC